MFHRRLSRRFVRPSPHRDSVRQASGAGRGFACFGVIHGGDAKTRKPPPGTTQGCEAANAPTELEEA